MRWAACVGIACAIFLAAGEARAQGEEKRIALVRGKGPVAKRVLRAIAPVLKRRGFRLEGVAPPGDYVEVAREGGFAGFLSVDIQRKRRRWIAVLTVRSGASGEVLGETRVRTRARRRLARAARRAVWKKLRRPLGRAEPPPPREPAPEPAPEPDVAGEEEPASEPEPEPAPEPAAEASSAPLEDGRRPRAFDAAVGMRGFSRSFSYEDDLFGELREYDLAFGPTFGAWLSWFPGAHFEDGWPARFGLAASVAASTGLDSETGDGVSYPTRAMLWSAGLRLRHRLAGLELRYAADYGSQEYAIADADEMNPRPEIPDVSYRYLRAGVEARKTFGDRVTVAAEAGYRYVLESGEIEEDDFFPRLSVHGVDASATVSVRVAGPWSARLRGGVERYFYSMNPEPGDPRIAGGAVDQYLTAYAAAAYAF